MTVNGEKLVCGSKKMVHEVFPGAVVMPTLAQNIVCGNFLKPVTVWFLAEDAVPTNCRRLTKESEDDDGKDYGGDGNLAREC